MNTLDAKIAAAAEAYKSGQVPSKAALAKVKRLIRAKVASMELQRSIDLANDSIPACP